MLSKETIEEALKEKISISYTTDKLNEEALKVYTNNASWLIGNNVKSLGLAASIAEEFARLTMLEMNSVVEGSSRANYINNIYQKTLDKLRNKLVIFNAVGGGFLKPFFNGKEIVIDLIPQTDVKPLSVDSNGNINSVAFISQITKGEDIFTRLEKHTFNSLENIYTVENIAFRNKTFNKNSIGVKTNLNCCEEWKNLKPKTTIVNVTKPLFAYYCVPNNNNLDQKSCLGCSVFGKAINLIHDADMQYTELCYEYESARRKLYVDKLAVQKENGRIIKIPDYVVKIDSGSEDFFEEFSPTIRDESYLRGLNKIKQEIENTCSLSFGTISDLSIIPKTASEIKSQKQRSYATISRMQKALELALRNLIDILNIYIDLYNLIPSGTIQVNFEWDDSIVVDAEQEQKTAIQEVNSGLMSKKKYLMRRYGLSEEQAIKELEEIKAENNLLFEE